MIKAVILDYDDTVCMTEENCFYLENEVLRRMGRPLMSREVHKADWGSPLFNAIPTRSPGIDVEEFRSVYAPTIKQFIEEGRMDAVPEENLRILDRLAAMGKELVILTSRTFGEAEHLIAASHPLAQRVSSFYHKDNMKYHKPDPRAFAHIEQEHGWKPEECVYVGDSISDAVSAKGAGLHFIVSLESGLRTRDDFDSYPVDAFIQTFPELPQAITELEKAA